MRDFKDFILITPEIAPKLPQGLHNFFMRLGIPTEKWNAIAIVTETLKPPEGDTLPLILDIDVYREIMLPPRSPAIWEALEELRQLKNEIFFDSLTEKAKELFR
jgi:uncharacterized protein (TIGR04255 family)